MSFEQEELEAVLFVGGLQGGEIRGAARKPDDGSTRARRVDGGSPGSSDVDQHLLRGVDLDVTVYLEPDTPAMSAHHRAIYNLRAS